MPAAASASRGACEREIADVVSSSAAMWRWRMPVRVRIHSSLVSTRCASSSLVRTSRRQIAAGAGDAASRHRAHRRRGLGAGTRHARRSRARSSSSTPLRDLGVRLVERVREAERVGAAVALHHDALQPDQRGAVVAAMIDAVLERAEHRHRDERRELA